MYDSINLRLLQSDAVGVDFLEETSVYLDNVGEHYHGNNVALTGDLGGLKVVLNRHQMKIKDGSLCKWYLGDNFQAMTRVDAQRAIERLSDTLHLPIDKAMVMRLDVAYNFNCRFPLPVYLNHLGLLKFATRLEEPNGLYYKQTNGCLCFYDKVREQRSNGVSIPILYKDKNILRYEQRFTQRLAKQFKVAVVTAAMLYDEAFYASVLNRWGSNYFSIHK